MKSRNQIGGVLLLLGYFCCFCALIMSLAGIRRAWHEHRIATRWTPATAQVKRCDLNIDHPFTRDGGGTVYSLHCRLAYVFESQPHEFSLRTPSVRPREYRERIEDWAALHGKGSVLNVLVNPADPAELAVTTPLPVHQFGTSGEAWITTLAFAIGAVMFFAVGRHCAHSKKEMLPA